MLSRLLLLASLGLVLGNMTEGPVDYDTDFVLLGEDFCVTVAGAVDSDAVFFSRHWSTDDPTTWSDCANACRSNPDCVGFDHAYNEGCQLYTTDGATWAHAPADHLDDAGGNPASACALQVGGNADSDWHCYARVDATCDRTQPPTLPPTLPAESTYTGAWVHRGANACSETYLETRLFPRHAILGSTVLESTCRAKCASSHLCLGYDYGSTGCNLYTSEVMPAETWGEAYPGVDTMYGVTRAAHDEKAIAFPVSPCDIHVGYFDWGTARSFNCYVKQNWDDDEEDYVGCSTATAAPTMEPTPEAEACAAGWVKRGDNACSSKYLTSRLFKRYAWVCKVAEDGGCVSLDECRDRCALFETCVAFDHGRESCNFYTTGAESSISSIAQFSSSRQDDLKTEAVGTEYEAQDNSDCDTGDCSDDDSPLEEDWVTSACDIHLGGYPWGGWDGGNEYQCWINSVCCAEATDAPTAFPTYAAVFSKVGDGACATAKNGHQMFPHHQELTLDGSGLTFEYCQNKCSNAETCLGFDWSHTLGCHWYSTTLSGWSEELILGHPNRDQAAVSDACDLKASGYSADNEHGFSWSNNNDHSSGSVTPDFQCWRRAAESSCAADETDTQAPTTALEYVDRTNMNVAATFTHLGNSVCSRSADALQMFPRFFKRGAGQSYESCADRCAAASNCVAFDHSETQGCNFYLTGSSSSFGLKEAPASPSWVPHATSACDVKAYAGSSTWFTHNVTDFACYHRRKPAATDDYEPCTCTENMIPYNSGDRCHEHAYHGETLWDGLTSSEQAAATVLGYDEDMWDEDGVSATAVKEWAILTSAEKSAAATLGYDYMSWDASSTCREATFAECTTYNPDGPGDEPKEATGAGRPPHCYTSGRIVGGRNYWNGQDESRWGSFSDVRNGVCMCLTECTCVEADGACATPERGDWTLRGESTCSAVANQNWLYPRYGLMGPEYTEEVCKDICEMTPKCVGFGYQPGVGCAMYTTAAHSIWGELEPSNPGSLTFPTDACDLHVGHDPTNFHADTTGYACWIRAAAGTCAADPAYTPADGAVTVPTASPPTPDIYTWRGANACSAHKSRDRLFQRHAIRGGDVTDTECREKCNSRTECVGYDIGLTGCNLYTTKRIQGWGYFYADSKAGVAGSPKGSVVGTPNSACDIFAGDYAWGEDYEFNCYIKDWGECASVSTSGSAPALDDDCGADGGFTKRGANACSGSKTEMIHLPRHATMKAGMTDRECRYKCQRSEKCLAYDHSPVTGCNFYVTEAVTGWGKIYNGEDSEAFVADACDVHASPYRWGTNHVEGCWVRSCSCDVETQSPTPAAWAELHATNFLELGANACSGVGGATLLPRHADMGPEKTSAECAEKCASDQRCMAYDHSAVHGCNFYVAASVNGWGKHYGGANTGTGEAAEIAPPASPCDVVLGTYSWGTDAGFTCYVRGYADEMWGCGRDDEEE